MRYEKVETHMYISDGQFEEIVKFIRLLHRLKIINVISVNPGNFKSDASGCLDDNDVTTYIRVVMRMKKM